MNTSEERARNGTLPAALLLQQNLAHVPQATSMLVEHWLIIKPWWRQITAATLLGVFFTFLMCEFVLTKWYMASAMIRPASQQGPVSPLSTIIGASSLTQTFSNAIGSTFSGQMPPDAAEYGDLLQSYEFTMALIQRHKLESGLDRSSHELVQRLTKYILSLVGMSYVSSRSDEKQWSRYEEMQRRFSVDYDDKRGNLTLNYIDRNRGAARRILAFYIDDLREKLRQRTIQETAAAIRSLENQLQGTADPLIQQQLAMIIAQQMQQEKTAQAEADFAFSVTDAPYVPTKVYKPKVILLCLLVGLLVPLSAFMTLELKTNFYIPFCEATKALELDHFNHVDRLDARPSRREAAEAKSVNRSMQEH